MHAAIISTPTDMGSFVGGHDYTISYLINLKDEYEPAIRHLVDAIFLDMEYISTGETELISSYLDTITEPLQELKSYGISILALRTQGTVKFDDGGSIPNWIRLYFFIIPPLGYFRVDADNKKYHHFNPRCSAAMFDLAEAASKMTGIHMMLDAQSIRNKHDNDVLWCEQCCAAEMIAISGVTVSVNPPELRVTCSVVERAIADTDALLKTGGPISALDRVHTTLHGYLKTVCADANISIDNDLDITALFKRIREQHPKLKNLGDHQEPVLKALRALSNIVDTLNPARNRGSMAHPNEMLLDAPEAALFINAARALLQYLDEKLSESE